MIELSLNEVETLSMKAARGSGFPWGLSDDIGRAARALAVAEAPWPGALLSLLTDVSERAPPMVSGPAATSRTIRSAEALRILCPVRTGAWLSDSALPRNIGPLRIEGLALPIWLAAMLAATNASRTLALSWPEAEVSISGNWLAYTGQGLLAAKAEVTIALSETTAAARPALAHRALIEKSAFNALESAASRTYVPASEGSRSTGAGGSRTDDE